MKLPPPDHQIVLPARFPIEGYDPLIGRITGGFFLPTAFLQHLEANGPIQKFYDANLVATTLERPTVILEGLKRPNYATGLCYCSVPLERQDDMGSPTAPPPGCVFAVYVVPINDEKIVIDFDWRIAAPGRSGIPLNWKQDFERILWPRR